MKNKPISEGFKFFLATILGFVVNFIPYCKTVVNKGTHEDKDYKDLGKIDSVNLSVVGIIGKFCSKKQVRQSIPLTCNVSS